MQAHIIKLVTNLHQTNNQLEEELEKTKQKKVFLSTHLSDARYSLKKHKEEIARLEKRYKRLKTFKKKGLASLFKFN